MSKPVGNYVLRLASLLLIIASAAGWLGILTMKAFADEPDGQSQFAALPVGITSFGAARIDDAVYVYGGHTGTAHSYSDAEQSDQLLKLDLHHPSDPWKVIDRGERLQGFGMVAHAKKLIVVGGFEATNRAGEKQSLHSQDRVRVFDTTKGQWSELPKLPAGRSSHDAAVLDGKLYVVGGWLLDSPAEPVWHKSALVMDLDAAQPSWSELPPPSFERRALAVVAHSGRLYAIGGMNHEGGPTREVAIYDPASKKWSSGPELPGDDEMAGFGAAAASVDDHLVVSTIQGDVLMLSNDGSKWERISQTHDARFFHRLIPLSADRLLSIGGASMDSGKFLVPEVIELP